MVVGQVQTLQNVPVEANVQSTTNISDMTEIQAPMVGTFYAASSEDAPAFVSVGDKVSKGQTVAIIEAMKFMNEITSDVDGIVEEILVENESLVEFGQPLMRIKKG